MRDRSPYLLGLDGRTVRIRSRYPPYDTLWMLDAPGGADERFETDVRYAARFHDISHADVTTVLRACRKLPAAAPPDPVRDIAEMQAAVECGAHSDGYTCNLPAGHDQPHREVGVAGESDAGPTWWEEPEFTGPEP